MKKLLTIITAERRLPTEAEQIDILLAGSAKGPCACGNRQLADRQTVLSSECRVEQYLGSLVRLTGRLRCEVCKDAHKLQQAAYVTDHLAADL